MRTRIAALGAALIVLLCIVTEQASASGFSLSEQRFETVFSPLTLRGIEGGSAFVVQCNVTLEGSFESRTFPIDRGALEVGVVTRASIGGCNAEGARIVFLTETLPWSVTFASYTGTLPRIATIRYELRGLRLLVEATPFMACLYRSTQATPAVYVWGLAEGPVLEYTMAEESPLALLSRLFAETLLICPGALQLSGTQSSAIKFNLI
jgi:hypothetical protein